MASSMCLGRTLGKETQDLLRELDRLGVGTPHLRLSLRATFGGRVAAIETNLLRIILLTVPPVTTLDFTESQVPTMAVAEAATAGCSFASCLTVETRQRFMASQRLDHVPLLEMQRWPAATIVVVHASFVCTPWCPLTIHHQHLQGVVGKLRAPVDSGKVRNPLLLATARLAGIPSAQAGSLIASARAVGTIAELQRAMHSRDRSEEIRSLASQPKCHRTTI
mmetsp:Transcript_17972/g.41951  ORF Transcript_17972/g.41951 Transcript_17972/m.41951 type:complete len:222 (+) Transcript_17972:148-813(+)